MARVPLTCILIVVAWTSIAYAESCPEPKEIAVLRTAESLFRGRIWEVSEGGDSGGHQVAGTLLAFVEEEDKGSSVELKGHIWWVDDGKFIGCEKIKGEFATHTRKFSLYGTKTTGHPLRPSVYELYFVEDGSDIKGKWWGNFTFGGALTATEVKY